MDFCSEVEEKVGEGSEDLESLVAATGGTRFDFPDCERGGGLKKRISSGFREFFDSWFYFKDSVGRGGKVIKVCKVKTLNDDADKYHAERLGEGMDKNGKIDMSAYFIQGRGKIREKQYDELPQIFYNVFWKRDMKLVGVRPLKGETFMSYPEDIRSNILLEKPGFMGVNYSSWGDNPAEKIRIYFDRKRNEQFVDLKYFANIVFNKFSGKVKSR